MQTIFCINYYQNMHLMHLLDHLNGVYNDKYESKSYKNYAFNGKI
jgi:hypothetical protein